ncbi:hypothetical protein [Vulcanococcus sp. Clear-D1]|uniref:hypothetical protein n=1 Tax=Vulcanococcus sp. Clear-D1 TaxID=2766970 RepID=UPI0019956FED|nr:hypothetical protein [Vulcanococcus sp. Clear-D1]MBD1194195.1 hypothetical protein [Vulcanococcus sp. Clear-D1]
MDESSITVRLPLGQAVNEALRRLQRQLLCERQQLQQRIDRELAAGEELVSQANLSCWTDLSDD